MKLRAVSFLHAFVLTGNFRNVLFSLLLHIHYWNLKKGAIFTFLLNYWNHEMCCSHMPSSETVPLFHILITVKQDSIAILLFSLSVCPDWVEELLCSLGW